jgi:hypothetical protein
MFDINTFFDKIFYINLAKDVDRNKSMVSQFKEFNIINYERIDADSCVSIPNKALWRNFIKTDDNYILNSIGCRQSHLKAIQVGKDRGYKRILIFEDDVVFLNDPNEILQMNIKTIEIADMFYFGGLIEPYFRGQVVEAHAYCITDKIMDDILQMAVPSGMEIDNFYAKIIQHMSYNHNQRGQYNIMMLQPFNTIVQNKQFESNIQ